jgi:hypothetical protein
MPLPAAGWDALNGKIRVLSKDARQGLMRNS